MSININFSQLTNLNNLSIKKFIDEDNITINLANTNTFKNDIDYLVSFLSLDEQKHCSKIPIETVRQKFIIHRALLRLQLATYLDRSPSSISIEAGEFGKPSISEEMNNANIKFNISHSENYALFAFNKTHELGIDIEEERTFSSLFTMASMVLATSEITELKALPVHEQSREFLSLWTRKEAISKALGQGLNMNFRDLILGFKKSSQKVFCQTHHLNVVDISRKPFFHATLVSLMPTKQTLHCRS